MEKPSDRVWLSVERITADLIAVKVRVPSEPIPTRKRITWSIRFSTKARVKKMSMPSIEIMM